MQKFNTTKEYLEATKELLNHLKEDIYKEVFEAFKKLETEAFERGEEFKANQIYFAKVNLEDYLFNEVHDRLSKNEHYKKLLEQETKDYIWKSGGAEMAGRYSETDTGYAKHIVEKDKDGNVLFEEIKLNK